MRTWGRLVVGLLNVVGLLSVAALAQSGPCTEQAIKALAGSHDSDNVSTDDVYFFSGALEKPVVGKAAYNDAFKEVDATRQNHKQSDDHVDRLVVAPSGDMAYEYGTSHISFDREKKHVEFTAAYLRVWKASGKECKIAAMMAQPEGER
jgi:ketosteroid isomerase-like protein